MKQGIFLLMLGLLIIAAGVATRTYGLLPENLFALGILAWFLGGILVIAAMIRMAAARLR